jgi:hypothetical protein
MGKPRYKRKVANMMVDKKFQIKYTVLVVALGVAIFAVLGGLYYNEMRASTQLMDINASFKQAQNARSDEQALLDSLETELSSEDEYVSESLKKLDEDLAPEVATRDTKVVFIMLGAVGVLVLLLALAGLYVTHRMAGPLYALVLFMKAAQKGEWKRIRPFRDGDEFVHLSKEFQKLAAAVKGRHEDELQILRAIIQDSGDAIPGAEKEKLLALIADKEAYVSH